MLMRNQRSVSLCARRGVFLLLLLGAWTSAAAGQELSAREIVDRAVARALEQQDSGADLRYQAFIESVTQNLGGDGEVKKTERERYLQYPLEGVLFEELVAREGEPLDDDDARDERKRRDEFVEKVRERRAKGEDPLGDDPNRIEVNEELFARYDLHIAGEEMVAGTPSWIIEFRPRAGDLPVRRQIDNALNNSTGRVWVSQDDYGLARVEFEMAKSVRFWGGILGTLRNTVGRLEFTRVAERVWMPTTIDIKLDLRILFRNIRRRFVREWTDYSPLRSTDE